MVETKVISSILNRSDHDSNASQLRVIPNQVFPLKKNNSEDEEER